MTLGEQIWITAIAKIGGATRFWISPEEALTELGFEVITAIDEKVATAHAGSSSLLAKPPLSHVSSEPWRDLKKHPAPVIPRRLGEGIARPFGFDDEIEDVV